MFVQDQYYEWLSKWWIDRCELKQSRITIMFVVIGYVERFKRQISGSGVELGVKSCSNIEQSNWTKKKSFQFKNTT